MDAQSSPNQYSTSNNNNSFIKESNTLSGPASTLLFTRGFAKFLENSEFSDIKIVTAQREYNVHRLILSNASEYFDKKFNELGNDKNVLTLEGPTRDFHLVLKFIYEGTIEFTTENVIPLLSMADCYLIHELKKSASAYIVSNLTRDMALGMLQKSIEFNAEDVMYKCMQVIAKNFGMIVESNGPSVFNFLPVKTLTGLTARNTLAVANEMIVYRVVCTYLTARKSEVSEEESKELWETIRFPFMSFEQLKEVEGNEEVPRYLLTEALLERLKKHEKPGATPQSTTEERPPSGSLRMVPRAAYAISLEYTADYDDKGVFHYIGTKGGSEAWSNPATRGRVRLSSSSTEKGNITTVLDKQPKEFWTSDVPSSWIGVSLGSTRSLVPNYYTLRHGGSTRADALRNWTLQGSNDGKNWIVLRRHVNDVALNAPFATASWPVNNCTQAFRHFRVLQTGHNSSSKNFLALSGFELYGDLYEKDITDGYVSP
eukprot:CAMPEP_0168573390 /NCGR_PEP_ID=MMETSP0413-20121227/18504_1 /TAXON_ID=136452 /ORGANISM="Filamoeba nolandi, Strain NC-AS-23-1" /LENGTH=485 /DNA_ID=CAMNT_0008606627 /DNA_START=66 /DNA_END=1523 /DNA_ORIENTATION=-